MTPSPFLHANILTLNVISYNYKNNSYANNDFLRKKSKRNFSNLYKIFNIG